MTWSLFGALAPQAMDAGKEDQIKSRKDSGDSGNCSEAEEVENRLVVDDSLQHFTKEQIAVKSKVGDLEFPLTQNLLNQVRADESVADVKSGRQAYKDLHRMNFVVNKKRIDNGLVSALIKGAEDEKTGDEKKEEIKRKELEKLFDNVWRNHCDNQTISNDEKTESYKVKYKKNLEEFYNKGKGHAYLLPNSENGNYHPFVEKILEEVFEYAQATIPGKDILKELIISCNQAGYDGCLFIQLLRIFDKHGLSLPNANDRKINIVCDSPSSLSVQYCPNMPVVEEILDVEQEVCKIEPVLEFTLEAKENGVVYRNGKVTFTVPEELKKHPNGKNLLGEIGKYFVDEDNQITEGLIANFEQEPKSLVADPVSNSSDDAESSFVMVYEDLSDLKKLAQEAVRSKDISALNAYLNRFESSVVSVKPEVVDNLIHTLNEFISEEDAGRGHFPAAPGIKQVYDVYKRLVLKFNGNISDEEYTIVQDLVLRLRNLRKLLEDRKDITTSPVAEQLTFPDAANSAEPEGDSGKQAEENVLATLGPAENNSNLINNKGGVMGKNEKSDLDDYLAQSEARGNERQRQNILYAEKAQEMSEQFLVRIAEVDREAALRYCQEKHGQATDNVLSTEEKNHVDSNVTIPKILYFRPSVEITHDKEDSGCSSGSSTPGPEAPAAVSDDHFTEGVPKGSVVYKEDNRVQLSGGSTPEIPEKVPVPVLNVTHTLEARDAKQIIDKHNKEGFTPLHVAALKGDINEGKHLIGLGADIEITSESRHSEGNTALHFAAQKGHKGFVKLLLKSGADANSVSSTGSGATPLHEAAYNGHVDVVDLLIEHRAKIDAGDRHNYTPLMYASAQGHSEVVLYLLQKGADLYLQSKDGETALHSAADYGHPGVASILIDVAEDKEKYVNVQSHCVGTALHVIAYNREINEGHKKVIKLLLDNGVCPYLENNPITNALQNDFIKENSLSMAITRKNTEFIEFMSSLGYSVSPQVAPTEVSAQISANNAPGEAEPDQNTQESELPTKTILTFTAIGLGMETAALGMYFVLEASLLATGIVAAIGVCCLAAAVITAIVHYCKPESLVENDNVTHVATNGSPVNSHVVP